MRKESGNFLLRSAIRRGSEVPTALLKRQYSAVSGMRGTARTWSPGQRSTQFVPSLRPAGTVAGCRQQSAHAARSASAAREVRALFGAEGERAWFAGCAGRRAREAVGDLAG